MHEKEDKIAQRKYVFFKEKHDMVRALNECICMEFGEALAALEPLGKKNVVFVMDQTNCGWEDIYL